MIVAQMSERFRLTPEIRVEQVDTISGVGFAFLWFVLFYVECSMTEYGEAYANELKIEDNHAD